MRHVESIQAWKDTQTIKLQFVSGIVSTFSFDAVDETKFGMFGAYIETAMGK